MLLIDLFGYTAAALTTFAFVPQAVKSVRSRDTKSISLSTFVVFTIGVVFWLIYGILRKDSALILANSITAVLSIVILVVKIKNDLMRQKFNRPG